MEKANISESYRKKLQLGGIGSLYILYTALATYLKRYGCVTQKHNKVGLRDTPRD